MFRPMRRSKQLLPQEESERILESATSGVLAVVGDEGFPYAVPLSYLYEDGKLYFHCAKTGHKLDAIRQNPKVSFCVIQEDQVVPAQYTTYYSSVIAFGTARILEEEGERRAALEKLAAKYTPDDAPGRLLEVEKALPAVCLVEVNIEHLTGKEAIERTRSREGVK